MESTESDKMTDDKSYPSPGTHHHGLPFYASQPPTDPQRPAPMAPMQAQSFDAQHFAGDLAQAAQILTVQQLAQQGLNVNANASPNDESATKKKVSRACDECRRKKVMRSYARIFSFFLKRGYRSGVMRQKMIHQNQNAPSVRKAIPSVSSVALLRNVDQAKGRTYDQWSGVDDLLTCLL